MSKNTQKMWGLSLLLIVAMWYGVMDRLDKINSNLKRLESISIEIYDFGDKGMPKPPPDPRGHDLTI